MTHPHTLGAPQYGKEFASEAQPQRVEGPRFAPRDPETMDPYGAQNHPLPPFKPEGSS